MATSESPAEPENAEEDRQAQAAAEAELEKLRASSLINQIKIEMGLPSTSPKQDPPSNVAPSRTARPTGQDGADTNSRPNAASKTASSADSDSRSDTAPPSRSGPEKSIGRFRR
jgi:hypothetical protein